MLSEFAPLFMLLLGWTLGLISPSIHERIRRRYRLRDLIQAVVEELTGLQYTLAFVAYRIRAREGAITDVFIDSILPILEAYRGPMLTPISSMP